MNIAPQHNTVFYRPKNREKHVTYVRAIEAEEALVLIRQGWDFVPEWLQQQCVQRNILFVPKAVIVYGLFSTEDAVGKDMIVRMANGLLTVMKKEEFEHYFEKENAAQVNTIDDFQEFLWQHKAWADHTFPDQTIEGKLEHCREELEEIRENPRDLHEWADATMLLLNAMTTQGITLSELLTAIHEKYEINKNRKWMNHRHVKEAIPCN